MLALYQVINYMIVNLEYTSDEVTAHFTAIDNDQMSFDKLLFVLDLELSDTMKQLAVAKLHRWPAALKMIEIRRSVA